MSDTVHCSAHGETEKAYVCVHLTNESSGLGFHHEDLSQGNEHPDAWCDDCEIIRAQHDGWDDVPEELCKIALLCTECYEHARIRNTHTSVTLADLERLRWKCGTCDEWHTGPMLDAGFDKPAYWPDDESVGARWDVLPSGAIRKASSTFLDEDYCAVNDENFFARGLIHLPIIGTAETFRWGVWGSLSRSNFETLLRLDDDPEQENLPPMFSWLSSNIAEYGDTLTLKMYAHAQAPGLRPHFRLERADHPLAKEFYSGITPERVKEIMFRALPPQPPM